MIRRRWLVIIALILGLLLAATVPAAPPDDVGIQGKLVDSAGEALAGPVALKVRIYEVPSGGESIYSEEHLALELVNGIFNLLLGTGTSKEGTLDASTFSSQNTYLEVDVGDETLEPRLPFSSVSYALQSDVSQVALFAESAADSETVDGQTPDQIRTTSFATITDVISETQVPSSIARSADLATEVQARTDALGAANATITGLEARITALEADLAIRGSQVAELLQRFSGVSRNGDTLGFVAMNVQIRNGAALTNSSNGLGNLILGYNENGSEQRVRTGSHNLVVGPEHTYASYGGVVAGNRNTISGPYATVTGGRENTASGHTSSVAAGFGNDASGIYATVQGGFENEASGTSSTVSGGRSNTASGQYAAVSAGFANEASGAYATVVGGGNTNTLFDANQAYADYSVVVGGVGNTAGNPQSNDRSVGQSSAIGGGGRNQTEGFASTVAGGGTVATGTGNTASGSYAAVLGGTQNEASGTSSTVGGGRGNTATGFYAGVGGGESNTASGRSSSVAGGGSSVASEGNEAFADYSAILGGWRNKAGDVNLVDHSLGIQSTVSGGANNKAEGRFSSSMGGTNNRAIAIRSVSVGGGNNKASNDLSTVLGGLGLDADENNGVRVGRIPDLTVQVLRVEGNL